MNTSDPRSQGSTFTVDPCIPTSWFQFHIAWRCGETRYEITVTNPHAAASTAPPSRSSTTAAPTHCGW